MTNEQKKVMEFHQVFIHPVATRPQILDRERAEARAAWMNEEVEEFLAASTLDEQADAMIDLLYFAYGTLVELGIDGEPLFDIVHRANMAKAWPDGKPRWRADGKVQKPPSWTDPGDRLRDEIRRQSERVWSSASEVSVGPGTGEA